MRAARVIRRRRVTWRIASVVLALIGLPWLTITVVTLLLASAGAVAWTFWMLLASVPIVLAAICWRHSDLVSKQLYERLDSARRWVAEDVLRGEAELTAEQLAYALSLEESVAEHLLAELSVDDKVHSRVTDDGRVVYSTRSPVRMRLDEGPSDQEALEAWDAARQRSHNS